MEIFRETSLADIPDALPVCAAMAPDLPLTLPVLTEKLFDPLTRTTTHSRTCFVNGEFAGLCCGTEIPWKGLGGIRLLAVSPKFENRGIGQRLLQEVENILFSRPRIRSLIMLATQGNYLVPGIDPDYQRGVRFLEKRGYHMIDTAQDFTGEVGLRPSAQRRFETAARAGYRIVRASAEHVPSLLRLVHAVDPGWELEVRRALNNTPATVHVACDGHDIAGFSCAESNNVGTGVLGPFAVGRDHRGKGLASALIHRSIEDLAALNFIRYRICWTNPELHDFFRRELEAQMDRLFLIFEKRLASSRN